MSVELLDCTLRDGTYVNDGIFGSKTISRIIGTLDKSNVDIIEAGWLREGEFDPDKTFFPSVEYYEKYLPNNKNAKYSLMTYHDRYDFKKLFKTPFKVDIIREIFRKDKFREAVNNSSIIKDAGSELFYQAVDTVDYTNRDLMELAGLANKILPSCVYLVDTHGGMFKEDLRRVFRILNEHLDDEIKIGFHSHNNLQLSFSLAIEFIELAKSVKRNIIIDSSLYGMGRGAGNLNTELIMEYLNKVYFKKYDCALINELIKEEILKFKEYCDWGYSIPYLLTGTFSIHSRYAKYLTEKYDIKPDKLREILSSLTGSDRKVFSEKKADTVYKENLRGEQV